MRDVHFLNKQDLLFILLGCSQMLLIDTNNESQRIFWVKCTVLPEKLYLQYRLGLSFYNV